jgi:acyl-CoA synthetase (NDP forming)
MMYFGFALADSMFAMTPDGTNIRRERLTPETVRSLAEEGRLTPCLNPSHAATISAMRERYGIDVAIPATPPRVSLDVGDSVVVMGVRGLPRLTDRHEYTEQEIASATFSFSVYTVQ